MTDYNHQEQVQSPINPVITVLGSGAIGGFYGGKLASKIATVNFFARSDYSALSESGLFIESVNGHLHLPDVKVSDQPSALPVSDIVLLCTKATIDQDDLKALLAHCVRETTTIVVLQNGLGMEQAIAELYPENRIIGGLCFICAHRLEPGRIQHLDYGGVRLGQYQMPKSEVASTSIDVEQLIHLFSSAGVQASMTQDLLKARWQKLAWNIPFNGLSVVLNARTQAMLEDNACRTLLKTLMLEVIQGASLSGYPIDNNYADELLIASDKMVDYAPSMKLDFDMQRPLEIDALFSHPIEVVQSHGGTMPLAEMLMQQLRFLQNRYYR